HRMGAGRRGAPARAAPPGARRPVAHCVALVAGHRDLTSLLRRPPLRFGRLLLAPLGNRFFGGAAGAGRAGRRRFTGLCYSPAAATVAYVPSLPSRLMRSPDFTNVPSCFGSVTVYFTI